MSKVERYRRVLEDNSIENFQDDLEDDEDDEEVVNHAWRRGIADSASFHRVATMDEEDDKDDDHAVCTNALPLSHDQSLSTSFDLDDDEAELGRYNLDFSEGTVERLRTQLSAASMLEGSLENGALTLSIVWEVFCKARDETRRRRMERMLSLNSDLERISLTITSYCDLTDRGMPIVILVLLVGVTLTRILLPNPWRWTLWGVLLFSIRVLWRPTYWYMWGRQVANKRKRTLEEYAESNAVAMELVPDFAIRKHTDSTATATVTTQHDDIRHIYQSSSSSSSSSNSTDEDVNNHEEETVLNQQETLETTML